MTRTPGHGLPSAAIRRPSRLPPFAGAARYAGVSCLPIAMSKSRRLQKDTGQAFPRGNAAESMSNRFAEDVAKRLWSFAAQFREANDPDKVFRSALRLGCSAFEATDGCV